MPIAQWCKKCGPRAKCGPRRHEMWPAEGQKISIVMWPAKLRSAARATRGPHLCCGPRAACCGPWAALKNVVFPPPPRWGKMVSSRGGVNLEREKFSICTPPPGREFRTKGKKCLLLPSVTCDVSVTRMRCWLRPARFFESQNLARQKKKS